MRILTKQRWLRIYLTGNLFRIILWIFCRESWIVVNASSTPKVRTPRTVGWVRQFSSNPSNNVYTVDGLNEECSTHLTCFIRLTGITLRDTPHPPPPLGRNLLVFVFLSKDIYIHLSNAFHILPQRGARERRAEPVSVRGERAEQGGDPSIATE